MAAPSKPNKAWAGSLNVVIQGFAQDVDIELYSRFKKQRNESFRKLAPSGLPIQQKDHDPATEKPVEDVIGKDEEGNDVIITPKIRKGVEIGKDTYKVMTQAALDKITARTKTVNVKEEYVFLHQIALDLAIDRYAVRPNEASEGSLEAVNVLWNGLLKTGAAWIAGSFSATGRGDGILVIYATDNGLWAALLPYEDELYPVPTWVPQVDAEQAEDFGKHIAVEVGIEPFDHSNFLSEARTKRAKAIEAVLNDEDVEEAVPEKAPAKKAGLMDALRAAKAA